MLKEFRSPRTVVVLKPRYLRSASSAEHEPRAPVQGSAHERGGRAAGGGRRVPEACCATQLAVTLVGRAVPCDLHVTFICGSDGLELIRNPGVDIEMHTRQSYLCPRQWNTSHQVRNRYCSGLSGRGPSRAFQLRKRQGALRDSADLGSKENNVSYSVKAELGMF
ncbi:hypothetical protein EVAR_55287_1 [Eumeta japonica]|uniref:Uncharacterized protein n=1 Tax=Eumeta variegata TaxID=151549 RepID=A0A4C1ZHG7_EUMVA|nr:hypothetical protein EVAR_55287_1 [Eumeta japonica]